MAYRLWNMNDGQLWHWVGKCLSNIENWKLWRIVWYSFFHCLTDLWSCSLVSDWNDVKCLGIHWIYHYYIPAISWISTGSYHITHCGKSRSRMVNLVMSGRLNHSLMLLIMCMMKLKQMNYWINVMFLNTQFLYNGI